MSDLKRPLLPGSLLPISMLSITLNIAIFSLSIVNFGLLSRWLNAAVAILTLLFHACLLFFAWQQRRDHIKKSLVTPHSPVNLSNPEYVPYGSPPKIQLDIPKNDVDAISLPELSVAFSSSSIFSLVLLTVIYLVAFGIMVDITMHGGAKSTLPSERAKGMTFPWNIKVQIAQTALVGAQTLLMSVILLMCSFGRASIARQYKQRREEVEYGLSSPDSENGSAKNLPF